MRDSDFLFSIVSVARLCVDGVDMNSACKKGESIDPYRDRFQRFVKGFTLCTCEHCEKREMLAHAYKEEGLILVSKSAFEDNLLHGNLGIMLIIYGVIHEYLHILYPNLSEKSVEYKTNRYFKKGLKLLADDALEVIVKEVGQY